MGDEPRLDLRVALKEVVESVGERIAKLSRARTRAFILGHGEPRYLKRAIQQVGFQGPFAVHFRGAPDRLYVVVLDLPEVILGLRVSVAEDATRVGRPVDVRHAVAVAINRNRMCEPLDACVGCPDCTREQARQNERGNSYGTKHRPRLR